MLALWWASLHLLLWGSVLAATDSVVADLASFGLLAVHAAFRFPDSRVLLARLDDGRWSIPSRGLDGLELGAGTCFAAYWVLLELVAPDRSLRLVLLRDQFDARNWRRLQVAVRERGSRHPAQ